LRTRLVFICLSSMIIAVSAPAFAAVQDRTDNVQPLEAVPIAPARGNETLASVLAIPPALPRGPYDRLTDYENGMAAIAQQFSSKLQTIVQGVQSGQLNREQGEQLGGEQYHIARMQFEFLSALHEMLQQDLARTTVGYQPAPSGERDIVMVELPFSSLELTPSLVQYLELRPDQVNAIQQMMADQRRNLEPLMVQMRAARTRLLVATAGGQTNEKEIRALANAQAGMLTKLILANARMQARLYKLLSRKQQRKLDSLKQSSEPLLPAAE
jgi:hypothetical protein